MNTNRILLSGLLLASVVGAGCEGSKRTAQGAAVGTAGGAIIGGAIGSATGRPGLGAIIGAGVGGVTGAVIGRRMDKQAKEIEQEVPGVEVERVGEGIVVNFSEKVLFSTGKADLNSASYRSLDKLVTVLNKYPDTDLEIDGHTDNVGTDDFNQALSERRARAVYEYVSSHNISASRVRTRGWGETAPKCDNTSESGKACNRRVEFQIFANERMKADARREAESR